MATETPGIRQPIEANGRNSIPVKALFSHTVVVAGKRKEGKGIAVVILQPTLSCRVKYHVQGRDTNEIFRNGKTVLLRFFI